MGYWRWRTEDERYEAISDDTIESTSPRVEYVHPEGISQCLFTSKNPEFEDVIKKCTHYEQDFEYDPDEDLYCSCSKFWGTGYDGLCEQAVIDPDETK